MVIVVEDKLLPRACSVNVSTTPDPQIRFSRSATPHSRLHIHAIGERCASRIAAADAETHLLPRQIGCECGRIHRLGVGIGRPVDDDLVAGAVGTAFEVGNRRRETYFTTPSFLLLLSPVQSMKSIKYGSGVGNTQLPNAVQFAPLSPALGNSNHTVIRKESLLFSCV